MNDEEQKLIDKGFEVLHNNLIQNLIDGGFNNPNSDAYPFFLWATGQIEDWNTMINQMANNLTNTIRKENKPVMNRAMRRMNKKK